jgi:hypothetical protein
MACKWLIEIVMGTWLLLTVLYNFFFCTVNPDLLLTFTAGIGLIYSGQYCKFSQRVLTLSLILDD